MMPALSDGPDHCEPRLETRERLLQVAMRLFAEHGVDRISLKAISDEAGNRNRSAVGYHFESKQGLVDAVLRRIESELGPPVAAALEVLEHRLDAGDIPSMDECVLRLLEPVFALYSAKVYGSDALRVLARIMHDPVGDVPKELRRSTNVLVERAVKVLQRVLPDKPRDDVELQMHHSVMATVNGLALQARFIATRDERWRTKSQDDIFLAYAGYLSAGLSSSALPIGPPDGHPREPATLKTQLPD